jgi:4-carboxymuconolactone decarboxylase
LSADQRALFEAITRGKRAARAGSEAYVTPGGGLRGPFNALLHAPRAGDAAQRLGESLRFDGVLAPRQREIAVLCVAAYWRAAYEWWAHARIASECGIEDEVIEAIRRRDGPVLTDPAERLVHDFSRALLDQRGIPDHLYADAVEALGEQSLVELVLLLGYYSLVSMVLVGFDVPIPDGEAAPFAD